MSFAKIDQSLHRDTIKNLSNLVLHNSRYNKIDKNLILKIKNYLVKNHYKNSYGGTWEWIDLKKRSNHIKNSIKSEKYFEFKLSNFFRNNLSFGIISSHWEKQKKKNWKKNLVSDILKNINSWEEFTKEKKEDYKYLDNSKDPGNPYGLLYQNNLVMIDTPRHDYYAKKIIDLLKNKKNPLILEIGGGYGGLFNQLLKRKYKFKYINIDLFNTLMSNYYYIKSQHKNINISLKNKLSSKDLIKENFFFIPFSEKIFQNLKFVQFCF